MLTLPGQLLPFRANESYLSSTGKSTIFHHHPNPSNMRQYLLLKISRSAAIGRIDRLPIHFWFIRQLSTMPYRHYPHIVILNFIEKTIGSDDNITKRKFRKLWQRSSRLRKLFESGQRFLCPPAKSYPCIRFVSVNISNSLKELSAACGRK